MDYHFSNLVCRDDFAHLQTTTSAIVVKMTCHSITDHRFSNGGLYGWFWHASIAGCLNDCIFQIDQNSSLYARVPLTVWIAWAWHVVTAFPALAHYTFFLHYMIRVPGPPSFQCLRKAGIGPGDEANTKLMLSWIIGCLALIIRSSIS